MKALQLLSHCAVATAVLIAAPVLGVRSFEAPGDDDARVLLLVDGNRVNDKVYGQA